MKSNQALYVKGAASMKRLLRGGYAGNHDLRLRAQDDDDEVRDVNDLGTGDDDDDDDDDGAAEVLVATFGSNHFSRRAKSGKLQIWRKK